MEMIDNISEQYSIRVKTGVLNRIITDATDAVEPPIFKGRRLKIYYATQSSTKPRFHFFVNDPSCYIFHIKVFRKSN